MDLSSYLGQIVTIQMDRPMGSRHPKHGFIYPINYGYVPETKAPDGEEIDAYLLGVFEPVERFTGKCIAFIERDRDNDPKLIIVPQDKHYSAEQIKALVEFQERFFDTKVIMASE